MTFNPIICPDCSYPPNFIVKQLPVIKSDSEEELHCLRFNVTCRDCGDVWEEEVDND